MLFIQCLAPVSQPRQRAFPPTEGVCYCMQIDNVLFRLNCSPPPSPRPFYSAIRNMNDILLKRFHRCSLFGPSRTPGSPAVAPEQFGWIGLESDYISDKATCCCVSFRFHGKTNSQTISDRAICCLTFGLTQRMDE